MFYFPITHAPCESILEQLARRDERVDGVPWEIGNLLDVFLDCGHVLAVGVQSRSAFPAIVVNTPADTPTETPEVTRAPWSETTSKLINEFASLTVP